MRQTEAALRKFKTTKKNIAEDLLIVSRRIINQEMFHLKWHFLFLLMTKTF